MPLKIAPATQSKFTKLGIHTPFDLVLHLPLRYEDETRITRIADLKPGESAQVEGEIIHSEVMYRPRRSLVCQLQDDSGILYLRFLNFYPSQQKQLAVGKRIRALGEPRMGFFGDEMVHPKCRVAGESVPLKQALTPVYPTTAGLPQATLTKHIHAALNELPLDDTLPQKILQRLHLPEFAASVRLLHQPPPDIDEDALLERAHPAWMRIKFDELLAQQLSMRVHYRERSRRVAPGLAAHNRLTDALLQDLPFALTGAQKKVWHEISTDLARPHPMQRLLQGDVGSGKTVVAALAALQAIENGYQVAFMAPTEILAEQHYLKLRDWLVPLGITPVWLSGSLKKKDKTAAAERIAQGDTMLAIGTHALFQNSVEFHKLGLVIVDEQHKFGVQQRLALRGKGAEPHQLMMSATPIPRTLAMSYYADLDVSVIDELPPGRTPIVTKLVSDARREEVFERVRAACLEGRQAYWVCPLIDESEALQLQTALETFATLTQIFPDLRIGLAHGKLSSTEKAETMAAFKAGELQLLVATTVIEVGVDVPNASLMVIDHAERMGLAQLHQLRGRVGRGAAESLCVLLFQQPLSELARARLKIIFENTDGFEIAQQDLRLRGPGELLGARQSGVPMLRFADLAEDDKLLDKARDIADEMLRDFPQEAQAHLQRWMANEPDYLRT
ncbi:ATP-dependent DNA helicase RecG [Sideroxydans lithotrophicus]|uniref:ATP-dependent DNA helicase RecG n=1 Tax=Sideroxydans lithotrophicus (strain ES-1) TaxID=580332 RepID=D5CLG5_SIDLE|nr:ATP-dependent DNA helicase RecG [Sideroxydans lithotrophicus]ADE10553.1 ATP-dependent DNA helicase RecG [Sideroxydans lithotrophicus ES-1]